MKQDNITEKQKLPVKCLNLQYMLLFFPQGLEVKMGTTSLNS